MQSVTERINFSDLQDYLLLQTELQQWIEAVIDERFTMPFEEALKDGVILCRLINKIKPDSVPLHVVHLGDNLPLPYKLENISFFIAAAQKLDVHASKFFEACALVSPKETKDIQKVSMTLFWIAKAVHSLPEYKGPKISAVFFEDRKCSICKKAICLGQNVRATSTEQWHSSCLCCSVCWKLDEPTQILQSDGRLYCAKCALIELNDSNGSVSSLACSGVLEISSSSVLLSNLDKLGDRRSGFLGVPSVPDVNDSIESIGSPVPDILTREGSLAKHASMIDSDEEFDNSVDGADVAEVHYNALKAPQQMLKKEVVMVYSPASEQRSIVRPAAAPAGVLPSREASLSGNILYVTSPSADRRVNTIDQARLVSNIISEAGVDPAIAEKYAATLVTEDVDSLESLIGISDHTLKSLGLSYGHIGLIRTKYVQPMSQITVSAPVSRVNSSSGSTGVNPALFASLPVQAHRVMSIQDQVKLKTAYDNHDGIFADDQQTYDYYFEFANKDDAVAQTIVGWMYSDGRGVAKDKKRSAEYFAKACSQDFAIAQNSLAVRYKWGEGVLQDHKKAADLFSKAAKQGLVSAQYNLAVAFENGKGAKLSPEKAAKYFKLAADHGVTNAQAKMGILYAQGKGVTKDEVKAVEYYKMAADKGNVEAQNNIGFLYDQGKGVEKNEAVAFEWYKKSANQGCACAQNNIASMYLKGRGVTEDIEQALFWYEQASAQGDADALYNLGEIYESGTLSLPQSKVKSDEYYERAVVAYRKQAHKGNVYAQAMLGSMYKKGKGVEQNTSKANKWYSKVITGAGRPIPTTQTQQPEQTQQQPEPQQQQQQQQQQPMQKVKSQKFSFFQRSKSQKVQRPVVPVAGMAAM